MVHTNSPRTTKKSELTRAQKEELRSWATRCRNALHPHDDSWPFEMYDGVVRVLDELDRVKTNETFWRRLWKRISSRQSYFKS